MKHDVTCCSWSSKMYARTLGTTFPQGAYLGLSVVSSSSRLQKLMSWHSLMEYRFSMWQFGRRALNLLLIKIEINIPETGCRVEGARESKTRPMRHKDCRKANQNHVV